jgi:sulfate adenylyltransferase subunit 1 (EFTu-like GTPase family)
MPVQYVNRPDSTFRGYCGLITKGEIYSGMPVQVLPSGLQSKIARIVTADDDLAHARAGQAVTLTLSDDIDVSRGDVLSDSDMPATVADRFGTRLVWIGPHPLVPGRSYLLKLATATAVATFENALRVVELETNHSVDADHLAANDIGTAVMNLDRLVAADRYLDGRDTGSFVLIDPDSGDTIALGIVESVKPPPAISGLKGILYRLIRSTETHSRSIAKAISWRTAGSFDTFVIVALITGNSKIAGSVALIEILTKCTLYYVHERVWTSIPWGRR